MFSIKPYLVTPASPSTRASTATYLDAAGVLKYAAINEVRPIIEVNAATNLIPNSVAFTKYFSGDTLFSAGKLSSDGVAYADYVQSSSNTTQHGLVSTPSMALVVGQTYTASVFVRTSGIEPGLTPVYRCVVKVAGKQALVRVRASAYPSLPVGLVSESSGANATVTQCSSDWVRITLQFTASETAAKSITALIDVGTGDAAEDTTFSSSSRAIAAWGSQIELGAASSYIPTSGVIETRAADVMPVATSGVSDLISSNVLINDYETWLAGTAYSVIGTKVIVPGSVNIWQVVAASTGVNPTTDTTGKWQNIGKVNTWKMFDGYMSTATSNANDISVTVRPGAKVDSIALFGLVATHVNVVAYDAYAGVIYSKTHALYGPASARTWGDYFFKPRTHKDMLIITDLPKSPSCTVSIQIVNTGGVAQCGMGLIGSKFEMGLAQYGLTFGIQDYSSKAVNAYGDYDVVERAYSDRVSYQIFSLTENNYALKKYMASVRATPCVYVGTTLLPESICYGYFKAFDPVINYLTYTDYNLEVEGLT